MAIVIQLPTRKSNKDIVMIVQWNSATIFINFLFKVQVFDREFLTIHPCQWIISPLTSLTKPTWQNICKQSGKIWEKFHQPRILLFFFVFPFYSRDFRDEHPRCSWWPVAHVEMSNLLSLWRVALQKSWDGWYLSCTDPSWWIPWPCCWWDDGLNPWKFNRKRPWE